MEQRMAQVKINGIGRVFADEILLIIATRPSQLPIPLAYSS
jgi:hypothetical protein